MSGVMVFVSLFCLLAGWGAEEPRQSVLWISGLIWLMWADLRREGRK
jgi:hypothetical protein